MFAWVPECGWTFACSAPKSLLQPVAGKVLGHIVELTPAIVSLARVALGIFIGHDRSHCFKYRTGNDIFGCDQFQTIDLAEPLLFDDICYFWISFRQIGHMEKGSLQSGNTFSNLLAGRRTDIQCIVFFNQSARDSGLKAFRTMRKLRKF